MGTFVGAFVGAFVDTLVGKFVKGDLRKDLNRLRGELVDTVRATHLRPGAVGTNRVIGAHIRPDNNPTIGLKDP